jgi:nitroreductase
MLMPFADEDSIYRLLEPVQRAPSVHNIQPWFFRIVADDRIDLCARFGDSARTEFALNGHGRLPVSANLRRELTISCGAALYNLRLAIRVTGHPLVVWLFPRDSGSPTLASVEIATGRTKPPTVSEQELYDAIPRRHTNRWPYDGRHPVPPAILTAMEFAAAKEEGYLRLLDRRQARTWQRGAYGADRKQRDGQGSQPDLGQWTNNGGSDSGVPTTAFGPPGMFSEDHHRWRRPGRRNSYPPIRDFRSRTGPRAEEADEAEDRDKTKTETSHFERRPQLMVLSTDYDRPLDWLRAGQALQHTLLTATRYGVSASFLTQPLELEDARIPGRADGSLQPLPGAGGDSGRRRLPWPWLFAEYPQMVLRVGYATHDAVVTARQRPDVLDHRTGRPVPRSRPGLAVA